MPWVNCNTCNQRFYKSPSVVREHNFCSQKCRLLWFGKLNEQRRNRITRICEWCGKSFEAFPCQIKANEGRFCSAKCRNRWHSEQMKLNNPFSKIWESMSDTEKEEYAEKHRQLHLGRKYSPEVNRKKAMPGELNPFYGKHHTKETRSHLSKLALERMQDPEFRQRIIKAAVEANRKSPNKTELKLKDILDKYSGMEWEYTGNRDPLLNGLIPDFTNKKYKNIVLEMYGGHWHTLDDISWNYTELGRIMAYNAIGVHCLVIWEDELRNEQVVVAKIKQFIHPSMTQLIP